MMSYHGNGKHPQRLLCSWAVPHPVFSLPAQQFLFQLMTVFQPTQEIDEHLPLIYKTAAVVQVNL